MGERKGTNKYYPPDYDPKSGGLNKFLGTHALRERARKIHLGILIIRFEMPYNIWCEGCGSHIGMGVRYNAEKKKIGMYYSTPVYQFRMKCHLCDNHFEIKTDPGNMDYIIVSGARRQENRWNPLENGQVVPEDKTTSKRLFDDAMFKLEHGVDDQSTAKKVAPALGQLINRSFTKWKDDFSANYALRAQFRVKKKELKGKERLDNSLLKKSSLNIQLVPEHEDDIKLASLLSLKPSKSAAERQLTIRKKESLLPSMSSTLTKADLGISHASAVPSLVASEYNTSSDDEAVKKKELKGKERLDNSLLKKSSLNIQLVPEHEDDIKLASLLSLKPSKSAAERQLTIRKKESLLPSMSSTLTKADLGISHASAVPSLVASEYNTSSDDEAV